MVDGPKTTEITSIDQIDQQAMQEFLAKTSPWDFYEITREEYMNKSDNDKKSLIFSFFNHMMSGKILLFVSLLFGVCSLFLLVHEHIKEYIKFVRSSRQEVFCKKGVLRNVTKFTGKQLFQSLFFNKVAGLGPFLIKLQA